MKKKVYNSLQSGGRTQKPGNWISINPANGAIRLSSDFSKLLKGQKINVVQDEERPKDWYIEPTKEATGIALGYHEENKYCLFCAKAIANEMMNSFELEGPHAFMISADRSDGMYAIFNKSGWPTGGGKKINSSKSKEIA